MLNRCSFFLVDPTSSALNDLETTSSAGDHEHHQSSGYTSPVKEIAINVVPDVSDVKRDETISDSETNNEIEDVVDSTLKPAVLMKKHPTQDTLNFVYKNSLDNSESNTGNGFLPSSNGTGSCTGLSMHKYVDRRPSGVPPPVRALKPGDFLYQKTMSLPNFPDLSQVDTRNVILEKA